ncbi:MAG: GGDEF domain-containing phosphodiesterase [Pseudomonadota bacterium]
MVEHARDAARMPVPEPAGERLWRHLDKEVIGRIVDAALDCCMILDGDEVVRWVSRGFGEIVQGDPVAAVGRRAEAVLLEASPHLPPETVAAILNGVPGQVVTLGAAPDTGRGGTAYQCVLRSVASEMPGKGFRVLLMFDVSRLMAQLASAERARAAIERRLNFDVETGLPNERRLLEVLLAALKAPDHGSPDTTGLILVEVMDFDQIVDLYGNDDAMEIVQEVVVALDQVLEPGTFVARTRQAEFAVVMTQLQSTQALVALAERLAKGLSFDVPTDLGDCRVSTILAAASMEAGSSSPDQFVNNARIAMSFRALPRRPGQVRLFEPEMREALEARSRTYNELHGALTRDEIEPFFQPQVRLSDRAIVGFEVLVRWRHPEQGLVPPGLFLEIADETGLLPQIDMIVMCKAMACLKAWHEMGFDDARISLNCTGDSLRDPRYVEMLLLEMEKNGLQPRHVAIEILETVLFGDEQDQARVTLRVLREKGFYLEIDDFGTGNASISHLITLNANAVKLDRSLIRNIHSDRASRMVVEATLALSRNLGLATLAEGTETEEQIEMLGQLGCDYAQGFGIAKPMAFDDTTAWLLDHMTQTSMGGTALGA